MVKLTKTFLAKLEDLFAETDYILRYEKGSFKSGYCILKSTKVVIINKYYSTEGKIRSIIEIIRTIDIQEDQLSEKNQTLYQQLLNLESAAS